MTTQMTTLEFEIKLNSVAAEIRQEINRHRRSPSPYTVFCTHVRPTLASLHDNLPFGEMGMLMGRLWQNINPQEREFYVTLSARFSGV